MKKQNLKPTENERMEEIRQQCIADEAPIALGDYTLPKLKQFFVSVPMICYETYEYSVWAENEKEAKRKALADEGEFRNNEFDSSCVDENLEVEVTE